MLSIPIRPGQTITGTPEQFARLAGYLWEHTAAAPDAARLVRLQLWNGQVVIAAYAELQALAAALTARAAPPPSRALYRAPAAAGSVPFAFPPPAALVTQTLNARGTTGGLRLPAPGDAQPANPASLGVSQGGQPYIAQICIADRAAPEGWTATEPIYTAPAGHILVAAVRIAVAHRLLLAADQLLAVRWERSTAWDCYLPAALINAWALRLAGCLAMRRTSGDQTTVRLPDPTL
ncbi:MAG TPA: hypothetical protein VKY74_14670 [Chloroflexia bacterium]|nr:hypothetical protein [Chloroflexia bacterium]